MKKTNAMRALDSLKLPYTPHDYSQTGALSGPEVAAALGEDPAAVFKTLVTVGRSGAHYVFVVPVCRELDLKKAAAAAGEKSVAMIKARELLPLTGYVHGGCSPIGMKKRFPTFLDRSAQDLDALFFSGGEVGLQIEAAPQTLLAAVPYTLADLT